MCHHKGHWLQGGEEGREVITSELNFKGKHILYIIVVTSQGMVKKTANTCLDNFPECNLTIIPVAYGNHHCCKMELHSLIQHLQTPEKPTFHEMNCSLPVFVS